MITKQSFSKGYTGFNIGLIFGGLCLLIAGYILSQPLVIAIGGTFFGASLGSLFSRMANKDIIENFALLSQPQKLTSDESIIKDFRRNWHMYYVNKIDGKYFWRHSPCDFSKVTIPGYLNTNEKNIMHNGKEYLFNVEAGIRGNKLITIHTIKGKENLVRIFPSINDESISGFYCGFVCLTTLDNTRLLGPTILAEDPSRFGEKPIIDDPESMRDMDNFWYSEIKKLNFELFTTPSNVVNIKVTNIEEVS